MITNHNHSTDYLMHQFYNKSILFLSFLISSSWPWSQMLSFVSLLDISAILFFTLTGTSEMGRADIAAN